MDTPEEVKMAQERLTREMIAGSEETRDWSEVATEHASVTGKHLDQVTVWINEGVDEDEQLNRVSQVAERTGVLDLVSGVTVIFSAPPELY